MISYKNSKDAVLQWRQNKPVLFWSVLFTAAIFLFTILYLPLYSQSKKSVKTLKDRKQTIFNIKNSGASHLTPDEVVKLQAQQNDFKEGFVRVSQMADVLNRLSDDAQSCQVRVLSMESQPVQMLKDAAGSELTVDGQTLGRVTVKLVLEMRYKALGDFLKAVEEGPYQLFVIDSMSIRKISSTSSLLTGDISISFIASKS